MVLIAQELQTEDRTVKVKELIEKLQEMDQDIVVNIYDGYDYHYGDQWSVCSSVEREATGWDTKKMFEIMLEISTTSLKVLGSDLFTQITSNK